MGHYAVAAAVKRIPARQRAALILRKYQAETQLTGALDALMAAPPPEKVRRAQAALRSRLGETLPARVWYGAIQRTPVGQVWLAVSDRGLVAVNFGVSEQQFLAEVRRRARGQVERSETRIGPAATQIGEYFAGRRTAFDFPIDLRSVSDFQRRVLEAAARIPRGQVTTYAEIARRIGRPRASRAVGQALGHNPVPIVIPCHRVLASDGSLRGYGAGAGIRSKEWLLKFEGVWR